MSDQLRHLEITVVQQSFDGPIDQEVVTRTESMLYWDIDQKQGDYQGFEKLDEEEITFRMLRLLSDAASSGFDVTVRNVSDPRLGMGGYQPELTIRPNFPAMRAKMAEVSAAKAYFQEHGVYPPAAPPIKQADLSSVKPVYRQLDKLWAYRTEDGKPPETVPVDYVAIPIVDLQQYAGKPTFGIVEPTEEERRQGYFPDNPRRDE